MNESQLLKHILPTLKQSQDIIVGPGDDCAVIKFGNELLLAAVDQLISDVHYLSSNTYPTCAGAKLLKRNLSDIAAMGGTPFCALVTIAASRNDEKWFIDFFAGIEAEAEKNNISICGGDFASLPEGANVKEITTLTILGKVTREKICLRSNAKPGDLLIATGSFGNSFKSNHHLDFIPRLAESAFIAGNYTTTMIDVSDGLLLDASRMSQASNCGLQLFTESIPLRDGANLNAALYDGEDYELLFAVSPHKFLELEKKWPFKNTKLSKIGVFNTNVLEVSNSNGHIYEIINGYEHSIN